MADSSSSGSFTTPRTIVAPTDAEGLNGMALDLVRSEDDVPGTGGRGVALASVNISAPPRSGRKWAAREQDYLCMYWGIRSIREIATALGRSPYAVYSQAANLEIGLGAPQGWEYVTSAATRVGYDVSALRRILRWAHVHTCPTASHPDHAMRRGRIVETADVDAAVARWCRLESAAVAARRLGISISVMGRLLLRAERAGVAGVRRDVVGHFWRLAPVRVDRTPNRIRHALAETRAAVEQLQTEGRRRLHLEHQETP